LLCCQKRRGRENKKGREKRSEEIKKGKRKARNISWEFEFIFIYVTKHIGR